MILLASCVHLTHVGCVPPETRASKHQERIAVGMSMENVREILGDGEAWTADDGGDGDMWHFSYGSAPDCGQIVADVGFVLFLVVSVVGWIVILAYSRDDSSEGLVGAAQRPGRCHFFVYFDPTGKVRKISDLSSCHD
jgi:hypothetical protein